MRQIIRSLTPLLLALSCVGCGEIESPVSTEVPTISGDWAFTQLFDGSGWSDTSVREVLVFDGEGNYYLKKYIGSSKVICKDGMLNANESAFVSDSQARYNCSVNGSAYTFSSMGSGTLSLMNSSPDCLEFSSRRLVKILGYVGGSDVDPTPTPDNMLNGSVLLDENNIVGVITDSSTGKGIAGIAVSDGYSFTKTDSNGVYQFASTKDYTSPRKRVTRCVFYTTPAEYEIATDNGIPYFYRLIPALPEGTRIRNDFSLTPLPAPETNWTLVAIGDPQCGTSSEVNRYCKETIADMKEYLPGFTNPYAVVLGDIVHDSNNAWPLMKNAMSGVEINGRAMPFFQVMGNHDHNALVDNAYDAAQLYVNHFGPDTYSFDRGNAHIVCFDNILVTTREVNSGKANGMTWSGYEYGMTDDQFEWFKKDISNVSNRADKILILCMHNPFYNTQKHATEIKTYAKQFREIYFLSGHTHFSRNYVFGSVMGKGGTPAYEIVTSTACGAWWEAGSSVNVTGIPSGYNVIEITGNTVDSWIAKGTNHPESHQMRVYDGNQTYSGTNNYLCNWYRTDNTGGKAGIVGKGYAPFRNSFVVEVFDDCSKYVSVELYQNGTKLGDFTHVNYGVCANICAFSYFFNERGKNNTTWNSTAGSYWYYTPSGCLPDEMTGWEVRVTRTFPGSGRQKVYTCNTFTKDYNDFRKK